MKEANTQRKQNKKSPEKNFLNNKPKSNKFERKKNLQLEEK